MSEELVTQNNYCHMVVQNNQIDAFENNAIGRLEVIMIDGEPWFKAKEVCELAGISNHRDKISILDDDERDAVGISDAIGRIQMTSIISEPGLYRVMNSCRIPSNKKDRVNSVAYKFQRWVNHEVIPSIRRKGYYSALTRIRPEDIEMTDLLRLMNIATHKIAGELDSIKAQNDVQQAKIDGIEEQISLIEPKPGTFDFYAAAKKMKLYSASGIPHQDFAIVLARAAGLDVKAYGPYEDAYVQKVNSIGEDNKVKWKTVLKQAAIDKIEDWAGTYLKKYRVVQWYKTNTKGHKAGDIKDCGYKLPGERRTYHVYNKNGSFMTQW